ncbi:ANTAR domain-containing protein [Geodermatophilus sp. CPCC 206100]|uniref:ANTAR domain-containing protein n=1 Tax=Geodermatophilus sp. CPCC 206100 TaxID=3020054 RepID=UPI003B00327C
MEHYELPVDQAFQVLAQASMRLNRKVRDVADHLVHTGELLGGQPGGDGGRPGPGTGRGRTGPGA